MTFGKIGARPTMKAWTAMSYPNMPTLFEYDAIENNGAGQHSSTATTWKDLVGGMDLSYSTSLSDTLFWTDRSFKATATGYNYFSAQPSSTLAQIAANGGDLTIECVAKVDVFSGTSNSTLLQISDGSQSDGILFCAYNASSLAASCKAAWGATNRATVNTGDNWAGSGKLTYFAVVLNSSGVTAYADVGMTGTMSTATATRASLGYTPNIMCVGTYSWSSGRNRTFIGEYSCLRGHNRALTQQELVANFKVDKLRFGL